MKYWPKALKLMFSVLALMQVGYLMVANNFYLPAQADDGLPYFKAPDLQIDIPGIKFTPASSVKCSGEGKSKVCEFPWIGEYINGLYAYAIGFVGLIAVVTMMFGGILWITAGGAPNRIANAKEWIVASITGLVIALSSFAILYMINPSLTEYKTLSMGIIEEMEGDNNSREITTTDIASLNIPAGTISQIVSSMLGKYTYDQTNRLKTINGVNYIDCSSFVCTVLTKSGAPSPDPRYCNTSSIFNSPPQNVDLKTLPAGTLVGYPPSASSNKNGHVWISLGNGLYAQSHGGKSGRIVGNSINKVSYSDVLATMKKYGVPIPYIRQY